MTAARGGPPSATVGSAASEVGRLAPLTSTPAPTVGAVGKASPRPGPRNVLEVGSAWIRVVGYTDCSGVTALPGDAAALDACFAGRRYFVAHNPGPFAILMGLKVGDVITWFDPGGETHRYRIVAVRVMRRNSGTVTLSEPDVTAQFQTCQTLDATLVRLLDAISI